MADEIIVRTLSEFEEACASTDAIIKVEKDIIIDGRRGGFVTAFSEIDFQGHALRSAYLTGALFQAPPNRSPIIKNGKLLDFFMHGSMSFIGAYDSRTPMRIQNCSISVNADGWNPNIQPIIFWSSLSYCNIYVEHTSGLDRAILNSFSMSYTDSRIVINLRNVKGSYILNGMGGTGCSFEGIVSGETTQKQGVSLKNSVWAVDTSNLFIEEGANIRLSGTGIYNADINPNAEADSGVLARTSDSILSSAYNNGNGFPVEVV